MTYSKRGKKKSVQEIIGQIKKEKGFKDVKPLSLETISKKTPLARKSSKALALAEVVANNIEQLNEKDFFNSNYTKLAKLAGFNDSKNIQKAFNSGFFRQELARKLDGPMLRKLRDKHLLGIEAKKVITLQVDAKTSEKALEAMGSCFDGVFIGLGGVWFGNRQAYFAVPDHTSRIKYFDQVFRILGEYNDPLPESLTVNPYEELSIAEIKDLLKNDL